TLPVKYSAGPLPDDCEPLRLISIVPFLALAGTAGVATAANTARPVVAIKRLRVNMLLPLRMLAASFEMRGGAISRSTHVRHLLQELVERDRIIEDAYACGVVDRAGNRRR